MVNHGPARARYRTLGASAWQSIAIFGAPYWALTARRAVAAVRPPQRDTAKRRRLLVDVSILANHDAGTGIQRVVRSLLRELAVSPPSDFEVVPVKATRKDVYRYAIEYAARFGILLPYVVGTKVQVDEGDMFLGLDLCSRIAPCRRNQYLDWQARGVQFAFVVYDLLPALHPDWFTSKGRKSFRHWLTTIAIHADMLVCISQAVANDLERWLTGKLALTDARPAIRWFHLGTDLVIEEQPTHSSLPISITGSHPLDRWALMVGTVEPRKGYAAVLDAYEILWAQGCGVGLVVVGQQGWHVDALVERLRTHTEAGKRLFWLPNLDDAQLANLYRTLDGLIMASEGEGFGLPLIEAARNRMPILARDLPVFREVAGERATYFSAKNRHELADALRHWFERMQTGALPVPEPPLTWQESANLLKNIIAGQIGSTNPSPHHHDEIIRIRNE
ncbi:glycosyltransferase family 4 protein [Burkholderia metallica]|uniref:glycosyltransferase family 4 protein n=1 Tax=Burkholderia metallica TaxID=488729 RepID=UPI00158C9088|nr:glycosyltransferase family 1 protein [Burkholderia metallica]